MAKTLSAFMAQNAKQVENKTVTVSKRFLDEDGKAIEWEIKSISAAENQKLRNQAQRIIAGKNQQTVKVDSGLYQASLAAKCVVFPDLYDAELQSSYGVMSATDLIGVMLTPAEFDDLINEILEVCGFKSETELVEEAKN